MTDLTTTADDRMRSRIPFLLFAATGAGLAIFQFFWNRSLWIDEASLALNLINRSYAELLQPLDLEQIAPILFLQIEKGIASVFQYHEYGLRLFPLLCFLLSIPLLYQLGVILFRKPAISALAVGFFCLCPNMIYYSSELKQYMVDVFVGLMIYYYGLRTYSGEGRRTLVLVAVGSLSIFLSNISVIILFSLGSYLFFSGLRQRKPLRHLLIPPVSWLLIFALYYVSFMHDHPTRDFMANYWSGTFMPVNPFDSSFWVYWEGTIDMMFGSMLSFGSLWVPVALFYVLSLGRIWYAGNRKAVFLLIMPVLVHLGLSALKLYPFHIRLILYLSPMLQLVIAAGAVYFFSDIRQRLVWMPRFLLWLPPLVLLIPMARYFPYEKQEIKENIHYLNERLQEDDQIYLFHGAKRAFDYYQQTGLVRFNNAIIYGTDNFRHPEGYLEETSEFRGRRWFLIAHSLPLKDMDGMREEVYIRDHLQKVAKEVDRQQAKGASVYLFEK